MNRGDTISRYRILGPLGRGGMGIVYQAEDLRLNRPVALKFLPPDSLTDEDKRRFLNEARAAAAARHPNICPIYDIEEADGETFIAMAYLEGETLFRKVARGALSPEQAVYIAYQIADGLECAHRLGIVHRDIKSGNIIVSPDGHASILDFGLALVSGLTRVTAPGNTVGTAVYMSPEQARGRTVDRRTDIWSLGVVLFEMLAGTLPFHREHREAAMLAIVSDPVPELNVSPDLHRVVEKALAKDPADRWQTAGEMAAELKRIQGGSSPFPAPDTTPTQTLRIKPIGRRKPRVAVAVAAGVLLAGALGFGVYRLANRQSAAVTQSRGSKAEPKQVAVLPFQVIGSAETTRNVAEGLVEILAAALSDFERFQDAIMAVPSSELRRRNITSAEEARRVFGVSLVVGGSAQPAGDNVQFTLTLVDAATLRQVGSRMFVYDVRDPIASRNQAVDQMVRLMNFDLAPASRTAIAAGDTRAPTAYSAYLQGRGLLARYDVAGNVDKAIASFTDATTQDPKYALAFTGLGEAYWRKARATGDKQAADLALKNAEYGVQLDGNLAIGHSVLGTIYRDAGRESEAIRELQKAMQLAPANAEAPRQLAEIYTNLGRFDEAEALYVQAAKSRPTDWYGHLLLGIFYYQRERYSEAIAELQKAKALTPDNDMVYRNLGGVYRMYGHYQEAVDVLQQSLKIRTNAATYSTLAGAYFYQHHFAEAVSAAEAAIDLDSSGYTYWGNLGIYYKWTPENAGKAETALRKAIELGSKFLETAPTDYNIRANLAEYRARLGDAKGAFAEIERIPPAARRPFTTRIALAYELSGRRKEAIEVIRANLKTAASLNQIKDDPDLGQLWKDPQMQSVLSPTR